DGLHAGDGGELAMRFVKGDRGADVDVCDTVTIGHAKRLARSEMLRDPAKAAACASGLTGIDEGNAPWLGDGVVDLHLVVVHVKGDVSGVEEVVGEVLLDDVPLIAAADDEIVDAVAGVDLHDVP